MPGADVNPRARLGRGTTVWHLAQIREGAEVGAGCIIGRGVYIGAGVRLGQRCKVQNYALIYEPARLDDGVFVGPAAVLSNDRYPRAITPDGSTKTAVDWEQLGSPCCMGLPSERARYAWRRSPWAGGRLPRPVQWWPQAFRTSLSSPACLHGSCDGSGGPESLLRRSMMDGSSARRRVPGMCRPVRSSARNPRDPRELIRLSPAIPADRDVGERELR